MAVGKDPAWGLQPSEFYALDPQEWWWMFDCRRTDKAPGTNMTEEELADLYALIGTDVEDFKMRKGTQH
jgi:hypothetical protein